MGNKHEAKPWLVSQDKRDSLPRSEEGSLRGATQHPSEER